MSNAETNGIAPNARRLLWAGFWAIMAAGVGFAIRGAIFADWARIYGFTGSQLGAIGGAGFTGFCVGIIIGGVIVDRIGYGKLVAAAFAFHMLSAVVTFAATDTMAQATAYSILFWGTFLFAVANGTLEAVANPLVATLFPHNRTHYLNILHASWPAGLVIGGLAATALGSEAVGWSWKMQLALFLVPTLFYGYMFFGQHFPKSEASAKGLSLGAMFKDVGLLGGLVICTLLGMFFEQTLAGLIENAVVVKVVAYGGALAILVWIGVITSFAVGHWVLFILFIAHALVGAVELGTDQWAQNITGNILTPTQGKILFVWTSALMFSLRFCAHWIEQKMKLSPVGILLTCAIFACAGLNLTSAVTAFGGAMAALTVYAIGKTFFWPTMLAVASDRFPQTGAIAISIMGGIGMMSAGLIGSPGLGYFKDRYASEELKQVDAALYEEYKAGTTSKFTIFDEVTGLDGTKLAEAKDADPRTPEQTKVVEADIRGDRRTLRTDSLIPAALIAIYLGLLLYFRSIGGYKPVEIVVDAPPGDEDSSKA